MTRPLPCCLLLFLAASASCLFMLADALFHYARNLAGSSEGRQRRDGRIGRALAMLEQIG